MPTPCFYLSTDVRGYAVEIFVNGAPIVGSVRDYALIALVPVSEWILQGENQLTVRISSGVPLDAHVEERARRARIAAGEEDIPPRADALPPREPPKLRVALCQGEIGELVEPGAERELLLIDYTPPPPPAEDEEPLWLPHDVDERVDLTHPWGTWSWERARPFDLAAEPERAVDVTTFLRDVRDAVAAGQLDVLLDASQTKFDETAPVYDFDPADARARLVSAWPEITKPAGWALAPFDERDLELRPCCGGRLLEPRTRGGDPILRQDQPLEGQRWTLPVYVAEVDGQLQIVR